MNLPYYIANPLFYVVTWLSYAAAKAKLRRKRADLQHELVHAQRVRSNAYRDFIRT